MTDIERKENEVRSGMMVGGSIVLGVGILFLLVNMDILPPLDETWPILIIIVGLALIIGGFVRKKKSETPL